MKNIIQTEHNKLPGSHYFTASILAFLLILALTMPSSSPKRNSSPVKESVASDSSAKITAPSSFPNVKIKNFGQMDEHFFRGAQPAPDDYKTLATLGIKCI